MMMAMAMAMMMAMAMAMMMAMAMAMAMMMAMAMAMAMAMMMAMMMAMAMAMAMMMAVPNRTKRSSASETYANCADWQTSQKLHEEVPGTEILQSSFSAEYSIPSVLE